MEIFGTKNFKVIMKILILDSRNTRETIEIKEDENIRSLKEKIKTKKGINKDIILHYGGEILEEDQKVSDYDIQENNVIVYNGQFRGGKLYK